VNGVPVRMMVDTGASMVLIPYEIAADIGISPNQLRYSVPVTTANGQSSVAPIRLESLRIGVIEIRDVEAAVAHPGRLTTALLGMSFLERLSETTFRGDRLILRVGRGGGVGDLFISVPPS
jgi:aspartyl protease family protein